MSLKSFLKTSIYFLLFIGLAFTWSCQPGEEGFQDQLERDADKRAQRAKERNREREERRRATKRASQRNLDVNIELGTKPPVASQEGRPTITARSVRALNRDQSRSDNYELWECKKDGLTLSYLLDKNPDTIDDEGTPQQRERVCELFRIKTFPSGWVEEAQLIALAHYQNDWCVIKLNEALSLHKSGDEEDGGFQCNKFEDLSFIFN